MSRLSPTRSRRAVAARDGLRSRDNWWQVVRFVVVGGSGYVVNLLVFALCVSALELHHLIAATLAFVVAVSNNFWWNRLWTFRARRGHAGFQAARYLAVSLTAFLIAALLLDLLVAAGVPKIPAQALSVGSATPLNFLGNKMWSFRLGARR